MSVVVIARLFPLDGRTGEMLDAIAPTLGAIRAEPGCQLFAVHSAPDGSLVLVERWASPDALADHGRGSAVRALREAREHLERMPAVVESLTPEPIGDIVATAHEDWLR